MIYELYPWVQDASTSGEMSGSAGGLILWPARHLLLVGFALLFVQAHLRAHQAHRRDARPHPRSRIRDQPAHAPVE